jgi:hypothetical protein
VANEIKPFKPLGPAEMMDTLAAIAELQAEILLHIRFWLREPTPELDARYTAARQREATMLETVMAFDRRVWNKGRPPADEASIKAEALAKKRRKRAEAAAQSRYHDDQPEGEGL